MRNSSKRHEDEENIEPGREEEVAIAVNPTRLAISSDEGRDTLAKRQALARLGVVLAVVAAGAVAVGEETGLFGGRHAGTPGGGENEGECIRDCLREREDVLG